MGLYYNGILQTVSDETFHTGLHFVGFGGGFVKYPTTVQSMEFSTSEHDILHCRTNDGLPLILGITFQYQLSGSPGDLIKLYRKFPVKGQYYGIFFNTASHLIAEAATNYSAYSFFNDKQLIQESMRRALDDFFKREYAETRILALQINLRELPDSFNNAITQTLLMTQEIQKTENLQQTIEVQLQTQINVAERKANATIATATGAASQILQTAYAQANNTIVNIGREASAYANIASELFTLSGGSMINTTALLKYIWWDLLGGSGGIGAKTGVTEMIIGVNGITPTVSAT
eukprot:g167.t1